jgi:hypothetical protein
VKASRNELKYLMSDWCVEVKECRKKEKREEREKAPAVAGTRFGLGVL